MKTWTVRMHNGKRYLEPLCNEAETVLANFKVNQPVKANVTGTNKARSLQQLKLYWSCCKVVSDNSNDECLSTKEKVDFQLRHLLQFYDNEFSYVDTDGTIRFKLLSISFANLKQCEANDYFNRAFDIMRKHLGVDLNALFEEAMDA